MKSSSGIVKSSNALGRSSNPINKRGGSAWKAISFLTRSRSMANPSRRTPAIIAVPRLPSDFQDTRLLRQLSPPHLQPGLQLGDNCPDFRTLTASGKPQALAVRAELRRRARAAVAVGLPAVALILAYVAFANITGQTDGYSDLEGFQLYGRVAQFADCKKFKPPGRTRLLCQTTRPPQRPGPTSQLFASDAPLNQKAFNLQLPRDSALLGRFGQQAILHQPGAYLSAIFEEYVRIFGLGHGRTRRPVEASHWRTCEPLPPAATNLPSGEKATA